MGNVTYNNYVLSGIVYIDTSLATNAGSEQDVNKRTIRYESERMGRDDEKGYIGACY